MLSPGTHIEHYHMTFIRSVGFRQPRALEKLKKTNDKRPVSLALTRGLAASLSKMRRSSQTGGLFLGLCRAAPGASSVKSEWQMERRQIKPRNGLSGRPGREGSCTASGLIRVTVLQVCSSQNRGVSYHGHDMVEERNSTGRVPGVTVLGTSGGWDWLLFLTAEFFTHPYSPACAVLCV